MRELPKKLTDKLKKRSEENALRSLTTASSLIDFSSNDYLGFCHDSAFTKAISSRVRKILNEKGIHANGATGSRLLSGNHELYLLAETMIADFHQSETALVFNSGYDANIGFFQSVPQRGDIIVYDEYIHASIRDGLTMSNAKAYKFKHNNIDDLRNQVERIRENSKETPIYIITESVFSMDGDSPDVEAIVKICDDYNGYLVVDEAHATGVVGDQGQGLVQQLGLENKVFARIVTFGKAIGAHGAAILGSHELKQYLVNFARSLIYTTALSPHSVATIIEAYAMLSESEGKAALYQLCSNIEFFNLQVSTFNLQSVFIPSTSAIHCAVIPGNEKVKMLSRKLKEQGFNVKPILSPTVPEDQERLRFCLHSFNTQEEIKRVVSLVATLVDNETNT